MQSGSPNWKRLWTVQILALGAIALSIFAGLYLLDHFVTGRPAAKDGGHGPLSRYLDFDQDHITDAVSALSGVVAAVLGIVITVVSILVQLSADRYTGVAQMFLRDRVNLAVMAYYIVACVCGVLLGVSLKADFVPRAALIAMMAATTGGLIIMAPYFVYVFWFLEPTHIVARLEIEAARTTLAAMRKKDPDDCARMQEETLSAMEELTDITSNSISGKDKIIASRAVDALRDLALEYGKVKKEAGPTWFQIGPGIRGNPDFVAMDPESLKDLEERRTWVEWKILRQYLGIYNEALSTMRDINYLIAIDTRYVGEAAGKAGDAELVTLVFRYMNSYLRSTINGREVRTAYNVMNQYRLLVESMLRQGNADAAVAGVKHMIYYGHVCYDMKLTFVTETVAYDTSAICQHAHELGVRKEEQLILAQFLELDRPVSLRHQERALNGVRKAQVKLAAYYLMVGEADKARLIAKDMELEPKERLLVIRDELEQAKTKDFWEIIDRGRNFEYMPQRQRACMPTFFEWLNVSPPAPKA